MEKESLKCPKCKSNDIEIFCRHCGYIILEEHFDKCPECGSDKLVWSLKDDNIYEIVCSKCGLVVKEE